MLPGLNELPEALRDTASRNWARIADPPDPAGLPAVAKVMACSDFVAAAAAADPAVFAALHESRTRADYDALVGGLSDDADAVLRRVRRAETARIAWRDLAGLAGVDTTLRELSDLADACIAAACAHVERVLAARHGTPRDRDGRPQRLVVLALGKLGAHELNFSSDVDLMFAYPDAGETDGAEPVPNETFFGRCGQRLIRLLDAVTADGFVYRVDMRLRPFGGAGPLALSFGAVESYYQEHGRDWERYALVKARPVTGGPDGERLLALLRPFVFRRYLDYGSFEQLRNMKAKIEREVARRELADHLKLGPGGIREIEFTGQGFQLIRGGREPALQERGIVRVLELLPAYGCLTPVASKELIRAYRFLRAVENRLQEQGDLQVHELPDDPHGRLRLAVAMGFPTTDAFDAALAAERAAVARHFASVFGGPRTLAADGGAAAAVWHHESQPAAADALAAGGFADPGATLARLVGLRRGAYWRALGDAGRARMDQLMPAVVAAAAAQPNPDAVLARLIRVIEAIDRRIAYLALLVENPRALEHLARLCGASVLIAERVARAPLLLDELLDPRIFTEPPTRAGFDAELAQMLDGVPSSDLERQMDTLRAFQQGAVLRVAVADLTGLLPLMKVSDRLTELAEIVLAHALDVAWAHLVERHGSPRAGFAVVAYGKLGGWELGYGSDLDVVFLHDADGGRTDGPKPVDNAMFFSRLGQRIVHLLATPTAAGVLYDVDTRLRPSGASGLLVSSIAAFAAYQRADAWTWEHQALLRARPVAGSAAIGDAFRALRVEVLTRQRDAETLRGEVVQMRARMRAELTAGGPGIFDLKQDAGGIADIEFLVQYLVLAHAHRVPALVEWTDNVRELDALVAAGILGADDGGRLADAYRALRERVHRLGLKGEPATAPEGEFAVERAHVIGLWNRHLGV